jgi:aspartate/methionine/tyrosine aminotransferase
VFASNSPLQEAVAAGLEQAKELNFFEKQTQEYLERRDVLIDAFKRLGFPYTMTEGTYFTLLDISRIKIPEDFEFPEAIQGRGRDFKACWFMAQRIGVSAIPVSEVSAKLIATLSKLTPIPSFSTKIIHILAKNMLGLPFARTYLLYGRRESVCRS